MAYPAALVSINQTYLENFLECLKGSEGGSGLPNDLQRNFQLIHELDNRLEDLKIQTEQQAVDILAQANHKVVSPGSTEEAPTFQEPTVDELYRLRQNLHKGYHLCNEKIILCDQASQVVKSFLARLEEDMATFAEQLGPEQMAETLEDTPLRKKFKKDLKGKGEDGNMEALVLGRSMSAGSVDAAAEEEVFCVCRRVSSGDMVGCDDEDCEFEWFHFECVGLKKQPKGKWFCPQCRARNGQ